MQPDPLAEVDHLMRRFGTIDTLPSGRHRARYLAPNGERYTAPHTFTTKKDANAWLTMEHAAIMTAQWTPKALVGPPFGLYAAQWLAERDLSPTTRADYQRMLDGHLAAFADMPLRKITPPMVATWHAGLKAAPPRPVGTSKRRKSRALSPVGPKPLGATMKAHVYSLLRSILTTAVAHDLIASNPCRVPGAGSSNKAVHKVKPASVQQVAAIVAAMPEQYRAMTLLAAWCGLRSGELRALRRADIEPDGTVVHVRRGVVRVSGEQIERRTKTQSSIRDVAVPPHLAPVVVDHLARLTGSGGDVLLFPAPDGSFLSPETLYRHFRPARDAAGLPEMHWHDLRHTGAVLAAATGATLAELMARLGHSTSAAALRYQHAAAGRDKAIAARLSELALE